MLGLNDRMSIREPVPEKTDGKAAADQKVDKKDNKDAKAKPEGKPAGKPDKPADAELSSDDAAGVGQPPVIVPGARSPDGVYEFASNGGSTTIKDRRDIGGLPRVLLRVGLPVARGPKATADTLFLDLSSRCGGRPASPMLMSGTALLMKPADLQQGPDLRL
jgi:hypothetical protein